MRREYENVMSERRDWFTYEAQVTALAIGASANDVINIIRS